jgi:hypothetical protein
MYRQFEPDCAGNRAAGAASDAARTAVGAVQAVSEVNSVARMVRVSFCIDDSPQNPQVQSKDYS